MDAEEEIYHPEEVRSDAIVTYKIHKHNMISSLIFAYGIINGML